MDATALELVVLAVASFRIQRVLTEDAWPPTKRFREWTAERFGPESGWHEFVGCPWCAGSLLTGAVFAEHFLLGFVPMWVYAGFAAAAVVGVIAELLALMDPDPEDESHLRAALDQVVEMCERSDAHPELGVAAIAREALTDRD